MTNPATKYTDEYRRETVDYIISTSRRRAENYKQTHPRVGDESLPKKPAYNWLSKEGKHVKRYSDGFKARAVDLYTKVA
jgi:cytolysin (calcineurin-like family phosphatase)